MDLLKVASPLSPVRHAKQNKHRHHSGVGKHLVMEPSQDVSSQKKRCRTQNRPLRHTGFYP